ncbi:MAG: PqqD family protein [Bacteroidaceae bacterium]|nr:PqqD family protein [Bacteroidaceae bacterium]MBQ9884629.1 PqqD family protein [Bacteroidaceae bacterium]
MKTNSLYIHREIAGESLLIPVGEATKELNGMARLNEVGTFIWKKIDEAENLDEIVKMVCEEYEVEEDRAKEDVYDICRDLLKRGMIMDIPELQG